MLSVVIPICNEEGTLPVLHERLMRELNRTSEEYEVIFVNDGSTDSSLQKMKELAQKNGAVKVLSFSRNFGHQIAVTAGLQYAKGDAAIVMDGDLQDPPEIIHKFVQKWREGYDVVYGIRATRKDSLVKKVLYAFYYRLLKMFSAIDIPLDSGDCCLMSRKVVDILNSLPERNRFVRALRSWVGFRQIGVEYERDKRYSGETKYTLYKLLELGLEGILSFSGYPLKIALVTGLLVSFMSIGYALLLVCLRFLYVGPEIPWYTMIVTAITFLGGIQLIILGLLGEYIFRIYDESKRRPLYILDEVTGLENVTTSISDNTGP